LGGNDAVAALVNDRGQIAGASYTNTIPNATTGVPTLDPFFWERGRMVDIGTLGGTYGFAYWMNNRGQVVGQSNLEGDQTYHPFLWDNGVLTDLGTLGGPKGFPRWINDQGEVVGRADLQAGLFHAFLWKGSKMTDLGTLAADPCSAAWSINARSQIVGNSQSNCGTPTHAFLWEKGRMYDLNTLIPPGSGFTITEAAGINDHGEIIAVGSLPNGDGNAVMLIPCGEDDPGGCQNDLLSRATIPGHTTSSLAGSASVSQHSQTPADKINQLRDRLSGPYHVASLTVEPED
jgi:probable HAF family extracellular repeat protein